MRFDMRFLLFFVPVNPNLTSIFLSGDQLVLLVYLVQQLFALNLILLLV